MKPEDFDYRYENGICLFQRGPFSQWYGAYADQGGGFKWGDMKFNCCEQWMMYQKAITFKDHETAEKVMKAKDPREQKALGREVKNFDPAHWDVVKYPIVFYGNIEKFKSNKAEWEFLMSFPINTNFAEAAPWDKIWGIGIGPDHEDALNPDKWQGENLLGKVISDVRKQMEFWNKS